MAHGSRRGDTLARVDRARSRRDPDLALEVEPVLVSALNAVLAVFETRVSFELVLEHLLCGAERRQHLSPSVIVHHPVWDQALEDHGKDCHRALSSESERSESLMRPDPKCFFASGDFHSNHDGWCELHLAESPIPLADRVCVLKSRWHPFEENPAGSLLEEGF
jgi:hypothetical protein